MLYWLGPNEAKTLPVIFNLLPFLAKNYNSD